MVAFVVVVFFSVIFWTRHRQLTLPFSPGRLYGFCAHFISCGTVVMLFELVVEFADNLCTNVRKHLNASSNSKVLIARTVESLCNVFFLLWNLLFILNICSARPCNQLIHAHFENIIDLFLICSLLFKFIANLFSRKCQLFVSIEKLHWIHWKLHT